MTISEQCFEEFCSENDIPFRRLVPDGHKTPDYEINIDGQSIIIEVKELTQNEEEKQANQDFNEKHFAIWDSTKVGDRIRHKIDKGKRQIERLSLGKYPGILILYDIRPNIIKGISPYEIEVAMYGWETIDVHIPQNLGESMRFGKHRFGKGKKLQNDSHTYISALGVLRETTPDAILQLDLYHNVFADKPIPIENLVDRKNITVFTVAPGEGNVFRGWAKVVR